MTKKAILLGLVLLLASTTIVHGCWFFCENNVSLSEDEYVILAEKLLGKTFEAFDISREEARAHVKMALFVIDKAHEMVPKLQATVHFVEQHFAGLVTQQFPTLLVLLVRGALFAGFNIGLVSLARKRLVLREWHTGSLYVTTFAELSVHLFIRGAFAAVAGAVAWIYLNLIAFVNRLTNTVFMQPYEVTLTTTAESSITSIEISIRLVVTVCFGVYVHIYWPWQLACELSNTVAEEDEKERKKKAKLEDEQLQKKLSEFLKKQEKTANETETMTNPNTVSRATKQKTTAVLLLGSEEGCGEGMPTGTKQSADHPSPVISANPPATVLKPRAVKLSKVTGSTATVPKSTGSIARTGATPPAQGTHPVYAFGEIYSS